MPDPADTNLQISGSIALNKSEENDSEDNDSEENESDETLMSRIASGDALAFERLVERHLQPIHAYAMRLTRSRSDADDLAQETFLKVWQRAETWQPGAVRVTTWLHRITHNSFVDAWRRRDEAVPLDTGDGEFDVLMDFGEEPAQEDPRSMLNKAMNTLPLNQRTAMALAVVSDFSTQETAHIMGLSPHAVESLLARARRALREWHARRTQHPDIARDAQRR